jgi:glycosyltransferase involved in cell wall biosynthesis
MTLTDYSITELLAKKAEPTTVFRDAAPPVPGLKVCVIVPARNEADHLPETLMALLHQKDGAGKALSPDLYEVLLLVNNCSDHTAAVAYQFQDEHPHFRLHVEDICLPKHKANIGTVRRLLMDEAYRRLHATCGQGGIIASTDGDTVVDETWVHHIMQEISSGVDAVGGRILTRSNNHPVRLWHLRDVMYRSLLARAEALIDPFDHDPWPRHYQYYGANLAVTCAAYERAGRLPEVPFLEDNAFHEALTMIDARIRKSYLVKVYTSDRQQGRVEVGFSEQLSYWNKRLLKKKVQVVGPVALQLKAWYGRNGLRQCYQQFKLSRQMPAKELARLARMLDVPVDWLMRQMKRQKYFGQLWLKVQQKWHRQYRRLPAIPITDAIAELRQFVSGGYRQPLF